MPRGDSLQMLGCVEVSGKLRPACARYEPEPGGNPVEKILPDGQELLVCADQIDWHFDIHIPLRHNFFLVTYNKNNSFVQSEEFLAFVDQPVGTVFYLDIHKQHRLANPRDLLFQADIDTTFGHFGKWCACIWCFESKPSNLSMFKTIRDYAKAALT